MREVVCNCHNLECRRLPRQGTWVMLKNQRLDMVMKLALSLNYCMFLSPLMLRVRLTGWCRKCRMPCRDQNSFTPRITRELRGRMYDYASEKRHNRWNRSDTIGVVWSACRRRLRPLPRYHSIKIDWGYIQQPRNIVAVNIDVSKIHQKSSKLRVSAYADN